METFLDRLRSWWIPHAGQREFLLAGANVSVLACGRRWGKTDVCAVQVAHRVESQPRSRQFLVAPTLEQAKILFDRVVEFLSRLRDVTLKPRYTPLPQADP